MTITTKTTGQDIMNEVLKEFVHFKININYTDINSYTTDDNKMIKMNHKMHINL